jgi:four helix bundle protein
MKNFRDLKVWGKAHQFTLELYRTTRGFPREELYGLTSQIRRATVSIGSNIAEGCGRGTDPEFGRFLQMALGSASEVEYQLLLAHDLEYCPSETYHQLSSAVVEVKRMLAALIAKLNADR